MHGTGHWLGLDVHDAGEYLQLDEPPIEQPDGHGARVLKKPSRVLQPGMAVTLEPGLSVRPGPDAPQDYWHIGIRMEDDALVTPEGCELITRGAPVRPDDIEALMQEECPPRDGARMYAARLRPSRCSIRARASAPARR